ncbi:MAG: hypothetical protein EPN55_13745 [Gammaproteobacteria bacterium]|nr:MAG: hypothetical protein EPN55_13745 [Gammaproteobacteria bacterium]
MLLRLSVSGALHRHSVYILPAILIILSSLAFLRVWIVQDIIWDDNFWAEAIYECRSYDCFFNTGFLEMVRPQLAPYAYLLFWLYRDTEYFYIFWHSINTLTSLASPLLLFFFLKNLFPKKQELAFFSAAAFVVFHLDQTLAFASASNYRIGLLLTILSFFLTERGFQRNKVRAGNLAAAAICAVLSHSVFIEATLTLEAARGLAIAYLVRARLTWARPVWKWTFRYWYLFVLLTFPIILYKLLYKPYGMYGHMYGINPLFFLEWRTTLLAVAHYLQFSWIVILHQLDQVTVTSWVLGAVTVIGTYFMLYKTRNLPVFEKLRGELANYPASQILQSALRSDKKFLLFGLTAFLPPTLFFQVVSRPPLTNMETYSSHAVISQMGYGVLAGWLLAVAYKASILRSKRDPWLKYFVTALFGAGVFFNSATIDQYLQSWTEQTRLWTAFTQRFPTVPDGKHFIFDVPQLPALYSDMNNAYTLELQLNLLYATSIAPSPFRRVTADEIEVWGSYTARAIYDAAQRNIKLEYKDMVNQPIRTHTFFGYKTIKPEDFIFVYYRDGELLVNQEISRKYPNVWYRVWLNKSFPDLPATLPSYPLRYKMRGPGAGY